MARRVSRYVKQANEATAAQLARDLPSTVCLKDTNFNAELKRTPQLSSEERRVIWDIIDTNMRDLASGSSMGWDVQEKKNELFDPVTSRFIVVRCSEPSPDNVDIIKAFVMFKFDYEVQVAESWRRYGIGRFLVDQIIQIARRFKMQKVLLTVLKANKGASRFYTSMGFSKDETSPDYVPEGATDEDVEPCDYDIMSLVL
ncbi:acyl-CoA N-acyltransferase [Irpex rosettiformis]|uniref:Acyl-CoA N-acyltransferase n=1 Tax=Irpex rosettiformis TaxID=378272 RepID=A0ACB8UM25_9APHY|nr:acyl-CoA N-acyltransferase [Irpex rosettiformis]